MPAQEQNVLDFGCGKVVTQYSRYRCVRSIREGTNQYRDREGIITLPSIIAPVSISRSLLLSGDSAVITFSILPEVNHPPSSPAGAPHGQGLSCVRAILNCYTS